MKIDTITGGPFLIDHDQKLQAQGALFYDLGDSGVWAGANVRYELRPRHRCRPE